MSLSTDEVKIKNLINMYDTLTPSQIEVLGNLKTGKQKQIINTLINKKAIKLDYIEGIEVCCNYFFIPNKKFALIGEVLKELMSNNSPILWFQKQEYPFHAVAFMKNKIFDVAVVEQGEETIFNAVLARVLSGEMGEEKDNYSTAPAPRENLLIIVEDIEQIDNLKTVHKNVIFACADLKNNIVKFAK